MSLARGDMGDNTLNARSPCNKDTASAGPQRAQPILGLQPLQILVQKKLQL